MELRQLFIKLALVIPFALALPIQADEPDLQTAVQDASGELQQNTLKKLNKIFRSNAPNRWKFTNEVPTVLFGDFYRHKGLVLGDVHPANIGFVKINGDWRFLSTDHDEAFKGSFIADFTGLVTYITAVDLDEKKKISLEEKSFEDIKPLPIETEMIEAYIKGLSDLQELRENDRDIKIDDKAVFELIMSRSSLPDPLKNLEDLLISGKQLGDDKHFKKKYREVESFEEARNLFVEGKIEDDKIVYELDDDDRPVFNENYTDAEIEKLKSKIASLLSPQWKVIDVAEKMMYEGGSLYAKRYWVLALNPDDETRNILELKQYRGSSISQFESIAGVTDKREMLEWALDKSWGKNWKNDKNHGVYELDGKVFLLRQKAVIDIKIDEGKDEHYDFGVHLAYTLGIFHAMYGENWAKLLANDSLRSDFQKHVVGANRTYLRVLKNGHKKKSKKKSKKD